MSPSQLSPAALQLNVGFLNPYYYKYNSKFTSGSQGRCSLGSENSMSPSQLSPGALQLNVGFPNPYNSKFTSRSPGLGSENSMSPRMAGFSDMTVFSSSQPHMAAATKCPSNPSPRSSVETAPQPASPHFSRLGDDPEAVVEGCSMLQKSNAMSSMALPSETIDPKATLTPYSDAIRTRKQAEDGKVKRPLNSFMVFSQQERRVIIAEKPKMHNAEISKQLGQRWRRLSDSEMLPYQTESKRLKEMHQVEFPTYKYQPTKNKHKVQNKPVKTESGRVSKPRKRDSAKPAAAKSRKGVGSRRKPKSAATTTTSLGVSPEVSSSLVSMLQASPRFQPILSPESVTAAATDSGSAKQFSRLIIRDNNCIRDVVESPPLPPSSSEVSCFHGPVNVRLSLYIVCLFSVSLPPSLSLHLYLSLLLPPLTPPPPSLSPSLFPLLSLSCAHALI